MWGGEGRSGRWVPAPAILVATTALIAAAGEPATAAPARQPEFVSYPSDSALAWHVETVREGQSLESLFGSHWAIVARFNRIDRLHVRPGTRLKVPDDLHAAEEFVPLPRHVPEAESLARFVLVDLSEQFLGAYEPGRLVFSCPVTSGSRSGPTPTGEFVVDLADPDHHSSIYCMNDSLTPYPMHSGLRFHVSPEGFAYWIHGRDMPGRPLSHGCIGLYDESMQNLHYGVPDVPVLDDALRLFEWAVGPWPKGQGVSRVRAGPRVRNVGLAPAGRAPSSPPVLR